MRRTLLLIGLAAMAAASADTGESGFSGQLAMQRSQAAIGRELGDYQLTRATGEPLRLQQLQGKPLLLSLIFTSCYHTCPLITRELAGAVASARAALGSDSFNVITVGFDTPVDTPAMMAGFKAREDVNLDNWYFLSADADTIAGLTADTGFVYFPSPRGFDHLSQTTLINAEGAVFDQIYGIPAPTLIVEPLKALILEQRRYPTNLAEILQTVRLFCTVYDPTAGRYRLDYSLIVAIFVGVMSLGGVAAFIVRAWKESSPSRAG